MMKMEIHELKLSAPALRALSEKKIHSLDDLSRERHSIIGSLHGIGKNALLILDSAMTDAGLTYGDEPDDDEVSRYIAGFEGETAGRLRILRKTIRELIPYAQEKMAYGMPTYFFRENLVHFAGYKKHIGLYPTPSAIDEFSGRIKGYATSKGAIQLPLEEVLPLDLVKDMVNFRIKSLILRPSPATR